MSKFFILPLVLLFALSPVFAQESVPGAYLGGADSIFVIESFDFNIKGRTRPYAILYNGEFTEGEEIHGLENLEKYIREKTQMLINQRVLKSASIDYEAEQPREDGKIPVGLTINTEDTWNFIVIPIPRYSSNTGLEMILRYRDYNFLGTMNPLPVNFGYRYDEKYRHSGFFELEANIPFMAFGYDWTFKFENYFDYRPDTEQPFYFRNNTGIFMEMPAGDTTVTFGFDESFILNEENDDRDKVLYGDFQNGFYMSTRPYVSWKIPTGFEVGDYGDLVYTPELFAVFNHEFPRWKLAENLKGPFLTFAHTLGFSKVDWIENHRRGFDVQAANSYTYDFYRKGEKDALSLEYSVSAKGYFVFTEFSGISAFLQYRQWFFPEPVNYFYSAGDALRGILDNDLHANYMLSLNLDFPFRILQFSPARWFNKPKLRGADIDFQFSPIVDMALYSDPSTGVSFNFNNMLITGGFEFFVFPLAMRSVYIRFSFGWNINETDKTSRGDREIFIGLGHHY
ncbi:MAG: hypothetical protein FWG46_00115 [Treponema sp.]|nr:hypothetical protein [Treponema sp.]